MCILVYSSPSCTSFQDQSNHTQCTPHAYTHILLSSPPSTQCKAALDDFGCALFEEHEEKWFVEVLMAATDYNEWFRMMVERAAAYDDAGRGGGRK